MLPGFQTTFSMKIEAETQIGAPMAHQMLTYSGRTLRICTVFTMLTMFTAKTMRMTMSIGQMNSAYSRPWVCDVRIPMKPRAMATFQTQPLQ